MLIGSDSAGTFGIVVSTHPVISIRHKKATCKQSIILQQNHKNEICIHSDKNSIRTTCRY